MVRRYAQNAVKNYLNTLEEAVACVTEPVLILSKRGGYRIGEDYSLILREGDPVQLKGGARIAISIYQHFRLVEDKREHYSPIRVTTTAYYYVVEDSNEYEILSYHWHPESLVSKHPRPHMHLEHGAKVGRVELAGSHIPTGRVALEDFLRLLIAAFKVPARKPDWEAVLRRTKQRFNRDKSW